MGIGTTGGERKMEQVNEERDGKGKGGKGWRSEEREGGEGKGRGEEISPHDHF